MNRATRTALLVSFVAIVFALAWDFTPRSAAGRNAKVENATRVFGSAPLSNKFAANSSLPVPAPTVTVADAEPSDDDDPDLPPGMTGRIDKEAYLRARGDYFDMLRGRDQDVPAGAREKAIGQMEKQEKQVSRTRSGNSALLNTTDWAFIGPNPIPLGQTSSTRVPVSGRTIAIAVHPTDPNTVYVGTA